MLPGLCRQLFYLHQGTFMARILYGVHGTGHGHAMRGLTIARAMPQHEFLFVGGDDAPGVLAKEFAFERLPNLGTVFKNYKVDMGATVRRALPLLWNRQKHIDAALRIIDKFKPDICMTDLEYFTPRAAKIAQVPCLTLDHQHVLTCCRHDLPANMLYDAWLQGLSPRFLFPPTEANIIISFYRPSMLSRYAGFVAPPILRQTVLDRKPSNAGHILVYQSNSTDSRLIDFLQSSTSRTAHVFGYGQTEGRKGNVIFHKKSENDFLDLLASCAYVIQGGSHTLMSEALYLGKPILSLPIQAMVEQRFNAFYLEKLGYGRQTRMADLNKILMDSFEGRLHEYKAAIAANDFYGNPQVFASIDHFASNGRLPGQVKKSASRPE